MIPKCLECDQEMIVVKESQPYKGSFGRIQTIKRWCCKICGYIETTYPKETTPEAQVLKDVKEMYKQQEDYGTM